MDFDETQAFFVLVFWGMAFLSTFDAVEAKM